MSSAAATSRPFGSILERIQGTDKISLQDFTVHRIIELNVRQTSAFSKSIRFIARLFSLSKLLVRLSKSRDKIDEDKYLNTLSRLLYLFAMKRNGGEARAGSAEHVTYPCSSLEKQRIRKPDYQLVPSERNVYPQCFPLESGI